MDDSSFRRQLSVVDAIGSRDPTFQRRRAWKDFGRLSAMTVLDSHDLMLTFPTATPLTVPRLSPDLSIYTESALYS